MPDEELKQKLTAILSADVKDYSRLMSQDRIGTVETLKSYREIISSFVTKYIGCVIDTPGDNILAEFDSVSDAVNCAAEIQRELSERNAEVPSARMMEWRIGISLGEVLEEESRIYGDGVNIAARIEGICEPGGICISSTVHDHVKNKLGFEYEDLGVQDVKNIEEPIRVYRVLSYPGAAAHRVVKAKDDMSRRWRNSALLVIGIIAVTVISILFWNYVSQREIKSDKAAVTEDVATPTEKPSIAVLPFENLSGDPEQEYFSDGISEDILDGLARNPGLIVKARTSSFKFKGQKEDIRKIGEMLEVTHVVEGSVRKSGNRIRVTAQLIDATEDMHVWSDKFDRELIDVFAVQDEISDQVLKALNVHLKGSPDSQMRTANMEAYDTYLLGRYQLDRGERDKALASFEKTVSLDPNYADAYGMLSYTHYQYISTCRSVPSEIWPVIRSLINKALSIDPYQPYALTMQNTIRFFVDRSYQDAVYQSHNLVRRYPNDNVVLRAYSSALDAIGRFDLSLRIADKVMETDPVNPVAYFDRGCQLVLSGQSEKARQDFNRMEMLGFVEPASLAWVAFLERDTHALMVQLDRGEREWGFHSHWYPIIKAAASTLEGDYERAKEVLSPLWQDSNRQFFLKSWMAALEGDLDRALGYYSQALQHSEVNAFWQSQAPTCIRLLFPEYRSHPKYQQMLKDVGFDEKSIAKLKIPPLPF